ncbi:hypothetical protein EDD11_004966 [Mortierella claussenii]|nr:hypothetical protein EDD11_004966 [Mortierella claussenii]
MAVLSESAAVADAHLVPILEDQILQLTDHEAWLDAQIRELEFAKRQDRTDAPSDDGSSMEDIRKHTEQRIDLLKRELVTVASIESIRSKVVNSAHGYQVILKSLFKDEQDMDGKPLATLIQERDEAVTQYLHIHRELKQVQEELSKTQIRVLDYQDENRKLAQLLSEETAAMKEASAAQESGSNQRVSKKVEEELNNVSIKHSVVSNVLQGLLLESSVDWANDPHYLEVMLKLKRSDDDFPAPFA